MAPKKAQNLVAKLRRKRFNKDAARQYLQEHGYKKARISQLLKNYEDLDAQSVSDGDSSLSAMSDKSIPKKEASDDNHEERKKKKSKNPNLKGGENTKQRIILTKHPNKGFLNMMFDGF